MRGHWTTAYYQARDVRIKCRVCRRWMRRNPTTASPARRAPVPYASVCTDCLRGTTVKQ